MKSYGFGSVTIISLTCLFVCPPVPWLSQGGPFVSCGRSPNDVFGLALEVIGQIVGSWDAAAEPAVPPADGEGPPLEWLVRRKERALLARFRKVVSALRDGRPSGVVALAGVEKLRSSAPGVELLNCVGLLERDFDVLENVIYGENNDNETLNLFYSSNAIEQFAVAMLNSSTAPQIPLERIHSLVVSELEDLLFHRRGEIVNTSKHTIEDSKMLLCDEKQSLQQLIFNLFMTLFHTQLKGFSVTQFSWMLLQSLGKGNFTLEHKKNLNNFEKNVNEQLQVLKRSISSASNIYWICDPKKHIAGTTYLEVTQLLQGYIENEINMNAKKSCDKKCPYYEVAESKFCVKKGFCNNQRPCNGLLYNCQFFHSNMRVCQSEYGSTRRYDHISYDKGTTFGDSWASCKGSMSNVMSWRSLFLFSCSYCFCICDSRNPNSDRYFSLKPSVSDTDLNKVATGLRFIKINQMFHLQVQEGQLGPRGLISEPSRKWVPISADLRHTNSMLKNGFDYHRLTYTNRTIDLDNVIAPKNMLVTGVKFRMLGTHLNLEVRFTPFDFATGNLFGSRSLWIGNDNTELSSIRRTEIDINDSDLPTKTLIVSEPDMTSNKFVKFSHSSITHDVAQTTLPFIDAQPVMPSPGTPLTGVGIYFKGTKSYAGFIGTSVFSYNFADNLNSDLFTNV